MRSRIAHLGAGLALALLAWRLLGPGAVGYDASWSLVWGDQLRHLDAPDFDAPLAPTPHPLANLFGALASLFGDGGAPLLMGLSYASFGALGVAAFVVGRRAFGVLTGVAFAAILLSRPLVAGETLAASIDVPFLALVLAALAVELGDERRKRAVLVLLALAGLLRPEAWLLSAAYLAWAGRSQLARLAPLAAAAPLLWLLHDLVATGDPLFSLTGTQDLAARLERDRGLGDAFRNIPLGLRTILDTPIAWAGLAAGAVALVFAQGRARLPIALLTLGLAGFLALGVADLPLLVRYLLVPAAMLALLCAAGVGAVEWLRAPRPAAAAATLAVAAVLAATATATRDDLRDVRRQAGFDASVERSLVRTAERAPAGCRPVQAATYRAVPVLAYRLGVRPSSVRVTRPARARRGLMLAAGLPVIARDIQISEGVVIAGSELSLPRSFRVVDRGRWWTAGARC